MCAYKNKSKYSKKVPADRSPAVNFFDGATFSQYIVWKVISRLTTFVAHACLAFKIE
jgi:hypothetical protein